MRALSTYDIFKAVGGHPPFERELRTLTPVSTDPPRYRVEDVDRLLRKYGLRIAEGAA